MRYLILILCILLTGCYHGEWINQTSNYNIGVQRTEYRNGTVVYKRMMPAEAWRNYERFVNDNQMQQQANRIQQMVGAE